MEPASSGHSRNCSLWHFVSALEFYSCLTFVLISHNVMNNKDSEISFWLKHLPRTLHIYHRNEKFGLFFSTCVSIKPDLFTKDFFQPLIFDMFMSLTDDSK